MKSTKSKKKATCEYCYVCSKTPLSADDVDPAELLNKDKLNQMRIADIQIEGSAGFSKLVFCYSCI